MTIFLCLWHSETTWVDGKTLFRLHSGELMSRKGIKHQAAGMEGRGWNWKVFLQQIMRECMTAPRTRCSQWWTWNAVSQIVLASVFNPRKTTTTGQSSFFLSSVTWLSPPSPSLSLTLSFLYFPSFWYSCVESSLQNTFTFTHWPLSRICIVFVRNLLEWNPSSINSAAKTTRGMKRKIMFDKTSFHRSSRNRLRSMITAKTDSREPLQLSNKME